MSYGIVIANVFVKLNFFKSQWYRLHGGVSDII